VAAIDPAVPRHIYHVALAEEWNTALALGDAYRRSTRGKSLDEQGYIHCSFRSQVETIANLIYAGRTDVVLLTIDTSRLSVELRVENLDGGTNLFPHIYGPLPRDAVVRVDRLRADPDGRFRVPPEVG
jgi:glutathione S-transferase